MIGNEEMIRSIQGLLSIESVAEEGSGHMPYGSGTARALDYVLKLCDRLGFRTKNCDNRLGYAEIGQGEPLMGILAHLDVVPAGSDWDFPPFEGTLADGKLYGRGAADDKGPLVVSLYAMKDVLDSGIELLGRVRMIFGMAEESGEWADINYYKETEEIPSFGFTPDADFPAIYGEKGIAHLCLRYPLEKSGITEISGGNAPNMVADSCRVQLSGTDRAPVEVTEIGRSAHGSTPEQGENAVSKAMAQLGHLESQGSVKCPLAAFYNEVIGFDLHGERAGCHFSDEQSGQLTFNVGMVAVQGDFVEITADIRYPVTCTLQEVEEGVRNVCAPYGVTVSVEEHMKPVYMDKDGDVIQKLMAVYREVTGDDTEPSVMGGGTYARAMENIVAFGPMFPGREYTEHKKNEYMYVEDLEKMREIYSKVIVRLLG